MPRIKRYKNRYLQAFLDRKCAVIHVRVPKYVRLWYIATYGSPVVLDVLHSARALIEHSICQTNSRTLKDVMTMSMAKWAAYEQSESFDPKSWLTIVLPDVIYRKDKEIVVTGDRWDVYDTDASSIRDALCDKFWSELIWYLFREIVDCMKKKTEYRLDWTLLRFCAEHGIAVDMYESIRQGYFRQMKRRDKELAETREAVRDANNEKLAKEGEGVKMNMLSFLDEQMGVK